MCTTVLFGKNTTIDGSVIIGRNVDTFAPYDPIRFYVRKANENQDEVLKSTLNGFSAKLPKKAYRCQLAPSVDIEKFGIYGECGFNEKNVGMSATESFYANKRVLAYDPLVKEGLDEDLMTDLVLPYINSAKHGVEYLGAFIEKYGSPAGNGVIFSDKDNIWYMEILTGHHWVAQRIPDNACCVIANQISLEDIDFNDSANFMWSDGIKEFVEENNLNAGLTGWNVKKIFGTSTEKDRHYNTPRVWFGQKYLNSKIIQSPVSGDLPLLFKADRKLSVEDAQYILSSHYNETEFDPYGKKGTEIEKYLYRPISLNRTQNSHVMQIRNNVPYDLATILWLCVGVPAHTPYVAFYGNSNDTDKSFSNTSLEWNINDAYWMYRTVTALVEGHYSELMQSNGDYLKECYFKQLKMIIEADKECNGLSKNQVTDYLTNKNYEIVRTMKEDTMKFIGTLVQKGIELSKLTFNMDKNL